jgi:NADPH-dependent ferric siderophore reductase
VNASVTRPPRRPVVVRGAQWLTPRFIRVTAEGDLSDWPEPGPAAHMKVFLPRPDGEKVIRTYTVRHFDRARGEVEIEFFIHAGNGPAARWASAAAPGDAFELSGRPRTTFEPDALTSTYLFAGDASALPAIATCVEALPASASAVVVAAVSDPADAQPLVSPAALEVRWLHGSSDDAFVSAVCEVGAERAWIACEATVMRRARASLLESERYARGTLSTRGYWKRGEKNHPDHDTGEDDG